MALLFLSLAYLLLCNGINAAPLNVMDESYSFEQFSIDYNKKYADNEVEHRRGVFEKNLNRILTHNAKENKSYSLGIDEFMDTEAHEYPRGYVKEYHPLWKGEGATDDGASRDVSSKHQLDLPFDIDPVSTLPKAVDWRAHGIVGPVKSQGKCGSCWAFASATALEAHTMLQTNVLYTFSVQELVSCVDNPRSCGGGEFDIIPSSRYHSATHYSTRMFALFFLSFIMFADGGCSGATAALAMDFVATSGIQQEWQMGYTLFDGGGSDLTCPLRNNTSSSLRGDGNVGRPLLGKPVVTIDGYSSLPTNDYKVTMNAVAKMGPLVVVVACSNWHGYSGGVFSEEEHNSVSWDLNHAVVLMGYGTDSETGEDYWLIQNSWGPRWVSECVLHSLFISKQRSDAHEAHLVRCSLIVGGRRLHSSQAHRSRNIGRSRFGLWNGCYS